MYRKRDNVPAKLLAKVDALVSVYGFGIGRLLKAIQFDKLVVPSFPTSPLWVEEFWKFNLRID